jgi:hypothetical protein
VDIAELNFLQIAKGPEVLPVFFILSSNKKFAIKFIISLHSLNENSILKNIGAALVINIRAALFCYPIIIFSPVKSLWLIC